MGFPGGSAVKNPPVVQEIQETWVPCRGQEDLLDEEMATHSNICQANLMDRGAWKAAVPGVSKSRTRLNSWAFL